MAVARPQLCDNALASVTELLACARRIQPELHSSRAATLVVGRSGLVLARNFLGGMHTSYLDHEVKFAVIYTE